MSVMFGLHALSAAVWVGGMFFAYMAARPAAAKVLEVPERTTFWRESFARFFPWVWGIVIVLLATGFWLIFGLYGGMGNVGVHVHSMLLLGLIMMAIFAHIVFAPYRRMRQAIDAENWPEAGRRLGQIRMFIGINLLLGLVTIVLGSAGRYW
ncbi:membrane protein [Thioalkalivibrio paradoxus ARh 1]|uniref:Membrane protein n=1 Tax=Thioalkalivibrio paradoxus ARh 1 TaxID=713585 RepID=W0DJH3_9GAMM|nr:membrane protein [Thioalkalivibrio paradoxus ARh 1]